ncbi:hypothetical protein BT63DRAFT_417895 [Microthyrium microscopicum]|uniref:Frequency clock protein n=1 Tax=Microthyrium microscopicum TaxID=703497 RepID=A0A6A6TYP2_9PEZI|nr:hypothetical protein BT63DRAFT_417895 [Microthyrium microscopicum]
MDETTSQSSQKSTAQNPRRKPAAQSVSLKHHNENPAPQLRKPPLNRNESSASSLEVSIASHPHSRPGYQKDSSGESSNAEKWFEKSNNNVLRGNAPFDCDEPPFFLRNGSSENTPHDVSPQVRPQQQLTNTMFNSIPETGSGSEDFRSVIDDLTIENKRLKRRLKKFERQQNSHLDPEALFEVRVHGLSADKKSELEELLRNFVSKVDRTSQSTTKMSSSGYGQPASLLRDQSGSSYSRIGDSGYHSLSATGQNSSSMSGQVKSAMPRASVQDRKMEIQSYLLDIPVGLLPHHSGPLADKEKKKLIVRRLEQLFAGRDPSSSGHQLPIQQDDIAQLAARADRRPVGSGSGKVAAEGSREARIMRKKAEAEAAGRGKKSVDATESGGKSDRSSRSSEDDGLVEQRPTRPLDLDPYRAQIPAENMEYIRHLGFSPPEFESMNAQTDGHGWIYLNVLHNMAQLHLSNVTVDFVRKAVAEYSRKLEISEDGRKLRWRGGQDVTRGSSNNSPDQVTQSDDAPQSKRLGETSSYLTHEGSRSVLQGKQFKHAYSPLFHREGFETEDGSEQDMQYQLSLIPGASSGVAGGSTPAQKSRDDAPIVFYSNVGFYTDLSRDTDGMRRTKGEGGAYNRISADPMGAKNEEANLHHLENLRKLDYEKGPLSQTILQQHKAGSSLSSDSVHMVKTSRQSDSSPDSQDVMDFEASGIGGIEPADNFAISVRTRQNQKDVTMTEGADTPNANRRKAYPMGIRRALQKTASITRGSASPQIKPSRMRSVVQRDIITSKKRELPASRLPEGTFFHNSSDEEDDESDEETEDDMMDFGDADDSTSDDMPITAPQRMDWATMMPQSSDSEDEEDDDDMSKRAAAPNQGDQDSSDDDSMDLLATARAIDPEAVRVGEREFSSNKADRLADLIPAGSSAATAEGGSGFNSPALIKVPQSIDTIAASTGPAPTGASARTADAQQRRVMSLKRNRQSDDSEKLRGSRATKSPKIEGSSD